MKYLTKLLSPLVHCNYTINCTKDLIIKRKNEKIPEKYEMALFDAKSFFASVPLEHTIDIIIKRIYEKNEITTAFTKNEVKKLLTICTKHIHCSFNNDNNGVTIASLLGPVLANIFMVELEGVLVPKLNDHVKNGDALWMTPLCKPSMVRLNTFCPY